MPETKESYKIKNALEVSRKIDSIITVLLIALSTGDVEVEDIEKTLSAVWDINTSNISSLSVGE